MAINRADLFSSTYQLPQAPIGPAPQAQEPQWQDEIGEPLAGLQHIDGVTNEYFQKWAALKGFAREVQETMGVDVRYPDPSIPGSDRLHRIYLKALADLKAQGERLKTGQQMYMADRQRGAIFNQDPNAMYYDQMSVGTDIVDAKLDPIVKEANDKLQGPHFSTAINEAREYHARVKAMLENRRDTDPQNAGYWQRQIDSLIEPIKAVREFDPNRGYSRLQQGQINAAGTFLKKMTNLQKGTADSYQLSDTVFGDNGKRAYVSTDTAGESWGGGKIIRFEHYPEEDKTILVLRRPDGSTKKEDVSNIDPMSFAKGFMDNTRYASHGQYLDIWAEDNDYLDPNTGEVNYQNLLAKDVDKRKSARIQEYSKKEQKDIETRISTLRDAVKKLEHGVLWDDEDSFIGKDGREIQVIKRKDGYQVLNIKKLIPTLTTDQLKAFKSMSLDGIVSFLSSQGVHLSDPRFKDLRASNIPVIEESGTNTASPTNTDPLSDVIPSVDPAAEARRILEAIKNKK